MTQQEAMRKAIACLKLAERGGTPEESALAASKAQEIIDRYGLDVSSADYDQQAKEKDSEEIVDFEDDPLDSVNKFDGWWAMFLQAHVCKANGCAPYMINYGDKGRVLKVIGRPSDVQTVRYIYSYLKGEVKRLQALNCRGNSTAYKYQYGRGVVDTIGRKLREQHTATQAAVQQENKHNPMALVRVNNALAQIEERGKQLDVFVKGMKFKKSRPCGSATTMETANARAKGRKDGEQVRVGGASAALKSSTKEIQ